MLLSNKRTPLIWEIDIDIFLVSTVVGDLQVSKSSVWGYIELTPAFEVVHSADNPLFFFSYC